MIHVITQLVPYKKNPFTQLKQEVAEVQKEQGDTQFVQVKLVLVGYVALGQVSTHALFERNTLGVNVVKQERHVSIVFWHVLQGVKQVVQILEMATKPEGQLAKHWLL